MPACLVSLDGHTDILLADLLTLVGRGECCDAQVNSPRVSRRHCCVAVDTDHAVVRDLGSINGTWINGRRVEGGLLWPGDEFWIAHRVYRFEIGPRTPSGPSTNTSAPADALKSATTRPAPQTVPEMRHFVAGPDCEDTSGADGPSDGLG
jgi:pSer/pThr/pTyr-binding forkhead associated (FHA) protein